MFNKVGTGLVGGGEWCEWGGSGWRWLAEVGEQHYTDTKNKKWNPESLPPSTDTDDWVVMEELRRRRRQIIMQQWSSGKVVVFWLRKWCNNLCWNWLMVLQPYHISSGRCKITIQQFWGYERVGASSNNWKGTMLCLWEILWLFFLWREARFYILCGDVQMDTDAKMRDDVSRTTTQRKANHYREITSRSR